jgi:hypothetical protein
VALYAAYGTNLDADQMRERCPHSPSRGPGWLVGWRLTFGAEDLGWEGALATVVEDVGDQVFVMVYDVPPQDEAALDHRESAGTTGLYRKIRATSCVGSTSSTATRAGCRRRATSG